MQTVTDIDKRFNNSIPQKGYEVKKKMKLKDAIELLEKEKPVIYVFGRNVAEYEKIIKIEIEKEKGNVKAFAILQDRNTEKATLKTYIDRIFEKGE